ncbi:chaplin family protein [Dactylosporangium matsuzakiense]|uniref:Chaplin domain-containing protein n=1 Tax=Dactylosporangium matsuzakiense TaxID=53360 RepID=A0A9W6NJ98_9ACTN|nr:chaplin family protein [Dactylosporangium matsuzakiense]UWZ45035.1 DUF320 domain-containing protein [Dactylosporangium matsuzakiense]GLK99038.1 hypothetical protein GCM10017581_007790 [Dactylosporangium matsuzakiense]
MKTWVRKSLNVGVLSAGVLLVSGGAAHADWTTGYNAGLLNGNQFDTTLQVPVNVCGNSIAILGFADANCGGGATAIKTESASSTESATTEDWTSGYNAGVANGNQLDTTLQVPVNVSGNAVSLLGFSSASSSGGAAAVKGNVSSDNDNDGWDNGGRRHHRHHNGGNGQGNGNGGDYNAAANSSYPGAQANGDYTESAANRTEDWTSGYNAGLLNGNQFDTTLQAPINVSGNAIALLGFAGAQSQGGAWAVKGESATTESATTEASHTTGYNAGLLNGNQLDTTLQLPINLCGNSIAILGFSSANCGGGAVAYKGDGGSDNDGRGQGNGGWDNDGRGHHHHHGHGNGNGGWDNDGDGNGNGGYGGDGNGNGNGGYGGQGNANGGNGYGGNGNANGDNGYGGNANATGAYANSNGNTNGDASDVKANANNASKMHKASKKSHKSIDLGEHAKTSKHMKHSPKGNGSGLAAANDAGYGNAAANGDNGYGGGNANGAGDDNGGWDHGRGDDNGGWDHGRGHHRHHDGRGNGNGMGNGGATAVKGGCGDWTTGFNAGLLNGNQFDSTVQLPINISGNAVSVLGFSQAQSSGGAVAYSC